MAEKSISKVFIWQIVGKFALQGIAFLTVPFFTRMMSPTDYGQYAVYSSWLGIISLIIGLQTSGSIANAKVKYSELQYNEYLSSAITISFLSFLCVLFLGIIFREFLGSLLGFENYLIVIMIIQSFFNYAINYYLTVLIQEKESKKNALLSLTVSGSSTILAIIFIKNIDFTKYILKIFGYAIPEFTIGLVCFIILLYNGKVFIKKEYWSFCLRFSLPLILHGASLLIISQSDRIMLKYYCGEAFTGIYSVGYNLATIINVIMAAFNSTWIPFYYEYEKKNDYIQIKKKSMNYMFNFTIITLGFILCCPEVFKIIAPQDYWSGIQLLPIIAMAYFFNFLYTFPGNFEFFMEKTQYFSLATIIAAIINILGNFILIPKYNIVGAGISTLISYVFLLLIHDFFARVLIKDKKYIYSWMYYLQGMIPVMIVAVLYYFTLNLWIIRWSFAIFLGLVLLYRIIKNKSVY